MAFHNLHIRIRDFDIHGRSTGQLNRLSGLNIDRHPIHCQSDRAGGILDGDFILGNLTTLAQLQTTLVQHNGIGQDILGCEGARCKRGVAGDLQITEHLRPWGIQGQRTYLGAEIAVIIILQLNLCGIWRRQAQAGEIRGFVTKVKGQARPLEAIGINSTSQLSGDGNRQVVPASSLLQKRVQLVLCGSLSGSSNWLWVIGATVRGLRRL